MSSFSSILASLGGSEQATGSATAAAQQSQAKKPPTPKTGAAPIPPPKSKEHSAGLKRKADEERGESPAKIQRNETTAPLTMPSGKSASGPTKPPQHRPAQDSKPSGSASISKPAAPAIQSNKPPPKGSFREILARAEAAKAKQSAFGHIKHKPVEKPSRKERRLAQHAAGREKPKQKHAGAAMSERQADPKTERLEARGKKRVDLGYSGTMRPSASQPAYKGTMKSKPASQLPGRGEGGLAAERVANGSRYRYASYSEDEEEEEDDYDSDESDMEAAGFNELEEEEQLSLRAAKKEDEEALRHEEQHRRQKAEKRRKLEQLVAARKR